MKKMITSLAIAFALIQPLIAQQNDKLLGLVEKLGNNLESAVKSEDIDAVMSFYNDESKYLPDNAKLLQGKDEIREFWKLSFAYDILEFEMNAHSAEGNTNLIYETGIGRSKFSVNGGEMEFHFKYVNVWKKINGKYILIIDTYNRATPASEK